MPTRRLVDLDASQRRRELVIAVTWTIVSGAIVIAAYYLIGLVSPHTWTVAGTLAVGGALFAISLTRQFRKVFAAELPGLQAVRAIGITVGLFLAIFAGTYLAFPAGSFSRELSHTSALYFALTVLSTVGFGDITPETDPARVAVSLQMLLDFILVGVIVRAFVTAARTQIAGAPTSGGGDPPAP